MTNREIKFRAWNKKGYGDGPCWMDYFRIQPDGEVRLGSGQIDEDNDIALMQYTGLKDTEGKEIYEGDVLDNNDAKWEVIWAEAGFYLKEIGKNFKWIFLNEAQHSKVIGNVYERQWE